MNILFRVDSSNIIGTGHLYRCLNLASIYKSHNIIFITKKHSFNLNYKIREKYTCYEINFNFPDNVKLNIDTWLGESQEEDALKTIKIIKLNNLKIDWLVIDHYAINEKWESILKKHVKKICVIDDFINRKHNCNIYINQQVKDISIIKNKKILNEDCKIYVGNNYLFFHENYYNLKINKKITYLKRINIFMGGADLYNITSNIIDICNEFNKKYDNKLRFDVIIGKSNKNHNIIKQKIDKLKNFYFYYDLNFIGELLALADLAIGAPGTTSYERCLTQTPSIMICLADNQKSVIKKFLDSKTSFYIGDINSNYEKQLIYYLEYFNNYPNLLTIMSNHCKNFINLSNNLSNKFLN